MNRLIKVHLLCYNEFGDIVEIIIGKLSGFCNGVSNTVKSAKEALDKYDKVYCLGQIVHNERVIDSLEEKGMITVNSIEEVPEGSKVIIRAHGELKETYEKAKSKNIEVIDLTCGKIKVIRNKIDKEKEDSFIVIIGKKNHPETLGVKSFSGNNSIIIENEEDINDLIKELNMNKIFIVSQTTFNNEKFDYLVNKIKEKVKKEIKVDKTICNATSNRQQETKELAEKVDCMIIVGGLNSSNTKELEVVAKEHCKKVFLVQTVQDLRKLNIDENAKVGIMAGASTPKEVVDEIVDYLNCDLKDLIKDIDELEPYDEKEAEDKNVILDFIIKNDNCLLRENKIAHLTTSAWIVNKERTKVLMIYHNIYKSWAWVGGHADGDKDLLHVIKKEIEEETGLTKVKSLKDGVYGVNVVAVNNHIKRGKFVSSHLHLDVEYIFEADEKDPIRIKEDENSNIKWISIEEVLDNTTEEHMKQVYQRLNDKIKLVK